MMSNRLTIIGVFTLVLCVSVQAEQGQPTVIGPVSPDEIMGPMPIDPGVGDLDALSTSLRRLEPGNALHSTRVRISAQPEANRDGSGLNLPSGYRYSAPGVQAMFNRPDYLVRTGPGRRDIGRNVAAQPDGAIMELVPAGTVYDLRPDAALRHLMPELEVDAPDDWEDTRIDSRYRVNARVTPTDGRHFDRRRYPHIPPDTEIPSRLPRRTE